MVMVRFRLPKAAFVISAVLVAIAGLNAQTVLWNHTYSGFRRAEVHSICQTPDNCFLSVGSSRDSITGGLSKALFLKTSSSGTIVGQKSVWQGNTVAYDCKPTLDRCWIVTGYVTVSPGNENIGIAKYDSAGNQLFGTNLGGTGSNRAYTVSQTPDSGFFVAGYTTMTNKGDTDIVIAKIDKNGTVQFTKTFGGIGWDCCYALLPANDGGCVITGGTVSYGKNGAKDAFLARIDASGSVIWYKVYGDTGDDIAYNLTSTNDGGYAMVGSTTSFGPGQKAFLLKTDSLGNYQWHKTAGGGHSDAAYGVVQLPDSGFMVLANMPSVSSDSQATAFRTNANGASIWSTKFEGYVAPGGSPLRGAGAGNTILCYTNATVKDTNTGVAMVITPCITGTVNDIDGNIYHTVAIGTQVWMAENLRTTRFNDGMQLPPVTDSAQWATATTPGFCWYSNDSNANAQYGDLYNWNAVKAGKLAPLGWHVATDSEWSVLIAIAGGDNSAGGPLKDSGMAHWLFPNTGATNLGVFSALPGGFRFYDGAFAFMGYYGFWWSSTPGASGAWCRYMSYNASNVTRSNCNLNCGFSVRCIKGDPVSAPASPVIVSALASNGNVTVSWNAVNGATSYNLYYQAGTSVDKASATARIGVNSGYMVAGLINGTQYAFTVTAENTGGESEMSATLTATPQLASGTITDVDGNVYHVISIGFQVWTVENLKTTRFNDGSRIPLVTDGAIWANITSPGFCWYNNDTANKAMYGGLYNWYAVNSGNLAPAGWHVAIYQDFSALKDTTGFSPLLGGYRQSSGPYSGQGTYGYWWTSSTGPNVFDYYYRNPYVSWTSLSSTAGLSVRCVKN